MELMKKQVSHSFEVQNIRNQCGGKGRAGETEQRGMGLYDMLVIMQNKDKKKRILSRQMRGSDVDFIEKVLNYQLE